MNERSANTMDFIRVDVDAYRITGYFAGVLKATLQNIREMNESSPK